MKPVVLERSGDWPVTLEACRNECVRCGCPIHDFDPCVADVSSVDGVFPRAICASCWREIPPLAMGEDPSW